MAKFSQYRVFIAIVETNGISSAARLLIHSPSAVSKQLTALEHSINVQLIDRSNRKIKITDSGKTFYIQCKEILEKIIDAENDLQSTKQTIAGKLSFTMSKSLLRSSIFNTISIFSNQYTAIRFNIEISDEIKDLYDSDNDFAFRLGDIPDSSHLIAIPLHEVRLIFCATTQYLEKNGNLKTFKDLKHHQLILLSPNNFSDVMRNFFKHEKIDLNPKMNHTTNDIEVVYQSVRSGQCIGMMLDVSIKDKLKNNIFVNIFPSEDLPSKNIYFIYKNSKQLSKKHEIFKNFIKHEFTTYN